MRKDLASKSRLAWAVAAASYLHDPILAQAANWVASRVLAGV
jgi:hypothetical protein